MGDSDDKYSGSTNVKRNRDKLHRERGNNSSGANLDGRHNNDQTNKNDRIDWESSSSSIKAMSTINPNYPSSAGMQYMRNTDHSSSQKRRFPNSYNSSPPHKKNKKNW